MSQLGTQTNIPEADYPGYVLHERTILNYEFRILLPRQVKEMLDELLAAKCLLEAIERIQSEERRREELRSEREKVQTDLAIPARPLKRPPHTVPVYDWEAAVQHLQALKTAPGSGDKDVVKRDIKHFEKAMAHGPWRRLTPAKGWKPALATLSQEMPNFAQVTTFIAQRLALAELSSVPLKPPPILLLAEPGVGKTHFAERLAEILGTPIHRQAFDNSQANGALRGSDRHWGNTSVGALWNLIVLGTHANPVVVLDELDKAKTEGTGYRPADELLTLLEPVTSGRVTDQSVKFEFDASHVWYIATANIAKQISAPIRSRFTEFLIESPDIDARLILANTIYVQTLKYLFPIRSTRKRFRPPTDLQICRLAWLTPRQIRKASESVLAAAALAGRWHLKDADFDAAIKPTENLRRNNDPRRDGGEPFAAVIVGVR